MRTFGDYIRSDRREKHEVTMKNYLQVKFDQGTEVLSVGSKKKKNTKYFLN